MKSIILNNACDWINSSSIPEFAVLHKRLGFKASISFGKVEMRKKKSASINILFGVNSLFFFFFLVNRCKGFPKRLLYFCMGELGEHLLGALWAVEGRGILFCVLIQQPHAGV